MILLTGASFTSCSSSDDSSINDQKIQNDRENYLIGKWKVIGGGSGGGVYDPKIRIEGDCYLELMSSERTKCTGEATAYVYYDGEEPFMTKDVSHKKQSPFPFDGLWSLFSDRETLIPFPARLEKWMQCSRVA